MSAINMQASWRVRRVDDGRLPSFLIPTTPLAASYLSKYSDLFLLLLDALCPAAE
jgi:hypothetical protein